MGVKFHPSAISIHVVLVQDSSASFLCMLKLVALKYLCECIRRNINALLHERYNEYHFYGDKFLLNVDSYKVGLEGVLNIFVCLPCLSCNITHLYTLM